MKINFTSISDMFGQKTSILFNWILQIIKLTITVV